MRLFDKDRGSAWAAGEEGTISTVKKMMNRDNVLLSLETRRQSGELFDQMIVKKGKGQYPIKSTSQALSNGKRYGAYNKVSGSHFCIVRAKKGKKEIYAITLIPILLSSYEFSDTAVWNYVKEILPGAIKICEKELKYNSIIEIDGNRYYVLAKTGTTLKCGIPYQGKYDTEIVKSIKEVERYIKKGGVGEFKVDLDSLYDVLVGKLLKPPFVNYSALKNQGEKLKAYRDKFLTLNNDVKNEDIVDENFSKNEGLLKKEKVIMNIVELLTGNSRPADFSDLYTEKGSKGSKSGAYSGVISININQNINSKINIIDTSISGFYENIREVK